jgi:predicted SnoaL-like aldol condensation-catalyzing enzyme
MGQILLQTRLNLVIAVGSFCVCHCEYLYEKWGVFRSYPSISGGFEPINGGHLGPMPDLKRKDLKRNKEAVMAFYDLAFNQARPAEAMALYAGPEYIQHNPVVKDGKAGFITYFEEMGARFPDKRVHFKRVLTDGDYVVLHCLQEWPGDKDWIGIDIFRLDEAGKIVEHWDVLQTAPETSANPNGMF